METSNLDWNSLQFVLALGRLGSLEAAAKKLGVNSSTVSRRVRSLEHHVGARLFDRTGSGHRLTAVGQEMLKTAEKVEVDVATLERLADRADERLEGTIRVAAGDSIGGFLAPMVASFHRQHPLVIFEILASARLSSLVHREADMAVRFLRPTQVRLVSRHIATVGYGLYAAPEYLSGHPFRAGTPTRGHQLLGYHGSLAHLPEARWLDQRAAEGTMALRADRVDPLLVAAGRGLGLAVLPCCLADADPRVVRLLGPDQVVTRNLWLVVHSDIRRLARVRAFTDFLVTETRAKAGTLRGDSLEAEPSHEEHGAEAADLTVLRGPWQSA